MLSEGVMPHGRRWFVPLLLLREGAGEVKRLVAGPGVYICSQCIGLCNRIIAKASR